MPPSEPTRQNEIPTQVSQWISTQHLGTPIKVVVMMSKTRYIVWGVLICGTALAFLPIVIALAISTPQSVAVVGLYLLLLAGAWLLYASPPFRRYDKQHSICVYICPNGILGVQGGSVIYTYYWAQVKEPYLNDYGRGGKEYGLHLVDGRKIILKQAGIQAMPSAMNSEIERALVNYRASSRASKHE